MKRKFNISIMKHYIYILIKQCELICYYVAEREFLLIRPTNAVTFFCLNWRVKFCIAHERTPTPIEVSTVI